MQHKKMPGAVEAATGAQKEITPQEIATNNIFCKGELSASAVKMLRGIDWLAENAFGRASK